jgi:hypothetical protein
MRSLLEPVVDQPCNARARRVGTRVEMVDMSVRFEIAVREDRAIAAGRTRNVRPSVIRITKRSGSASVGDQARACSSE